MFILEAAGITYRVLSVTSSKPYCSFRLQGIGRLTAFFKLMYLKSAGEESAKQPPSLTSSSLWLSVMVLIFDLVRGRSTCLFTALKDPGSQRDPAGFHNKY